MEFGNVILDPSAAAAGAFALGLVGLVIWWLVRKRQKRVRLPTLRVMRFETRILPRLLLRPPPLLAFLCFLIAAATITGFALRPRTQVFTPFEPNQTRIHMFLDMSPSVAAQTPLPEYAQRVADLFKSLKESGRVTVSTSHGANVIEPQSEVELAQAMTGLGFQRAGLRLGTAMKTLIDDLGEVDRLIIASDRDQHSWTGFNWSYLLDDMNVIFFDVSGDGAKPNLFVNDARFLSTPSSPPSGTMEWDVELVRRGPPGAVTGTLDVLLQNKTLATFPWQLGDGKSRTIVRATWPATAVEAILKEGAGDSGEPLVFRVSVPGGDSLELDDEYRTELLGLRQDVLLVADTTGERELEDPSNQLQIALQVLGFKLKRQDFIRQPGPPAADYPFWVLVGGGGGGVDRFCPRSIQDARVATKTKPGQQLAKGNGTAQAALPKIWLAPQSMTASYKELCQCYTRLLLAAPGGNESPEYCEHVDSRSQWLGLLPSLGAKQIGGQVGDSTGSLAWHGKDQASGLEVLAFTVPLQPLLETGINHAQMPVLVRELLRWQGLLDPHGGAATSTWPRIDDVAAAAWNAAPPQPPEEARRLLLTNVPLGESLLSDIDVAGLPPRWTSQIDWSDKRLPAKKDREDPLPWLKLAALLAVAVTALEALAGLGTRFARFVSRRGEESSALGGLLVLSFAATLPLLGAATRAEAKVEFNLVGYDEGPITLATLAREVSNRTSIELESKPNAYAALQAETLADPWLWVRDVSTIVVGGGQLKADLALWIKRGGFLVIDAPMDGAQLLKLTEALAPGEGGGGSNPAWMPLPPDHELMRSFYLLDALPTCNGQIWRGFQYDGRLAILAVPYGFLTVVKDRGQAATNCGTPGEVATNERSLRIFVNLVMVALATDYKKDQIHLPEILKRLR